VGQVIAFADIVSLRRRRATRQLQARCLYVLAASVAAARAELAGAPAAERPVRIARLRKLEDLETYASAFG
jgi:hypothetical protein